MGIEVRVDIGLLESQAVPLKGTVHRLTLSELQSWGSSLKGTMNIQGETELSGIRVRATGAETTFPLMSPLPTELAGRHHI